LVQQDKDSQEAIELVQQHMQVVEEGVRVVLEELIVEELAVELAVLDYNPILQVPQYTMQVEVEAETARAAPPVV
jgi:hypothetical protein